MSENKIQESGETPTQEPDNSENNEQVSQQVPEFILNKKTGELSITDPSGKEVTMTVKVIEEESEEEAEGEPEPLSIDDFNAAVDRIDALDLTWTADLPPHVKPKNPQAEANLASEEFVSIQHDYPQLPRELHMVVGYVLTGANTLAEIVGGIDALKSKAVIAKEKIISPQFRSEYFFKHAIKVPYLSDIDWEVVLKLSEKNVEDMPAVAYGLLSLILREPFSSRFSSKERHITVAVNEELVDKFISIFQEIKNRLHSSLVITEQASKHLSEVKDNVESENKQLE